MLLLAQFRPAKKAKNCWSLILINGALAVWAAAGSPKGAWYLTKYKYKDTLSAGQLLIASSARDSNFIGISKW